MSPLVTRQLADLERAFPGATARDLPDGSVLLRVPDVPIPGGWNRATATLLFVAPPAYPVAYPDCFWVESPPFRLQGGGGPPDNANDTQPIPQAPGIAATWFSWHVVTWNVTSSTLLTFANFILCRFKELR